MYIENTIIIEGLDGAGTTTQARLIGEKFQKEGREVFLTHEPTDNPIGKVVRQVLQKKISTTPEALALLFSSDMDDHLYNEEYGILRQVKENRIVISDRYFYSSIAYQGVQCDMGFVENINSRFPHPRYLIFIDTLPSVCMDRIDTAGVICTPGLSFGPRGEGYVRFALVLPPERIAQAVEAIRVSGLVAQP